MILHLIFLTLMLESRNIISHVHDSCLSLIIFFPVKNKLSVAPLLSLLSGLTPDQSVMLSGEGGLSLSLPRVESILSGICLQLWLHQILETAYEWCESFRV